MQCCSVTDINMLYTGGRQGKILQMFNICLKLTVAIILVVGTYVLLVDINFINIMEVEEQLFELDFIEVVVSQWLLFEFELECKFDQVNPLAMNNKQTKTLSNHIQGVNIHCVTIYFYFLNIGDSNLPVFLIFKGTIVSSNLLIYSVYIKYKILNLKIFNPYQLYFFPGYKNQFK